MKQSLQSRRNSQKEANNNIYKLKLALKSSYHILRHTKDPSDQIELAASISNLKANIEELKKTYIKLHYNIHEV